MSSDGAPWEHCGGFPTNWFPSLGEGEHGIHPMPVFKKVMQMLTKVTRLTVPCIADFFLRDWWFLYNTESWFLTLHQWLRSLAVCFQKCSVHLLEWTFFSEVPLDHLIRFGVLKLPFPLFFFFCCYFWQWWCLKLLKWFTAKWINFPHLQMCFPVAPKFLFPLSYDSAVVVLSLLFLLEQI